MTGLILFSSLFLFFHPVKDIEVWTKVEVKEAFVSRKTSELFKDDNSAPEFGWHIRFNNKNMGRGSLYSVFYIPVHPSEQPELILVERDVFSDDIVSSVILDQKKKKYFPGNGEDFAVITKKKFNPDRYSGSDRLTAGASEIQIRNKGAVNFIRGDYTDYFKTVKSSSMVFISSRNSGLDVSCPKNPSCSVFPEKQNMEKYFLADIKEKGSYLRIRGPVGRGKIEYEIFTQTGANRKIHMLDHFFSLLQKEQNHSVFFQDDLSKLILAEMPVEARNYCRLNKLNQIQKNFCGQYLEK